MDKLVINCGTGNQAARPLTATEQAEYDQQQVSGAAQQEADRLAAKQRETDIKTVQTAAATDPAFAALARLLGAPV